MENLKVVIVHDNVRIRGQLQEMIPDYMDCIASGYGEEAQKAIGLTDSVPAPNLVILNGDEKNSKGIELYRWMQDNPKNSALARVPVVVLTQDEFSESSMGFLELGDVTFYEGDINEDSFFSCVIKAIEEGELLIEAEAASYSEDKNLLRVEGLSLRPEGEGENDVKRSIVLDMDEQFDSLAACLERNQHRNDELRDLYDGVEHTQERSGGSHFLNKIREEKGMEPVDRPEKRSIVIPKSSEEFRSDDVLEMIGEGEEHHKLEKSNFSEDEIPEEFRIHTSTTKTTESLARKIIPKSTQQTSQPAPQVISNTNSQQRPHMVNNIKHNSTKKKIVVIDDEIYVLKAYEIYLGEQYEVVLFDSGMKAIDYFVHNSADLLIIDTHMPNLGGVQTLNSIRWQKYGKNVPVFFVTDKRYPIASETLRGENVIGSFRKPITAGLLATNIDAFFKRGHMYETQNTNRR